MIIGQILKPNLSWNPIRANFCQLIASLYVILPQLILTNSNLTT